MVNQVNILGVIAAEAKDDTPIARHPDCPVPRQIAVQGAQAESGKVHVCRRPGFVETRENSLEPSIDRNRANPDIP